MKFAIAIAATLLIAGSALAHMTATPSEMVNARRALAQKLSICSHLRGCTVGQADLQSLCAGEPPEGPGIVNDVEHIPGTNPPVVAPPPLAQIEQVTEALAYPLCKPWCDAHKAMCGEK